MAGLLNVTATSRARHQLRILLRYTCRVNLFNDCLLIGRCLFMYMYMDTMIAQDCLRACRLFSRYF